MKANLFQSKRTATHPITFFFLMLPYGISGGFITVTLPFILVHQGFSVAGAAVITALGVSANIWRFLWSPLADLTLSLHKWYLIGTAFCALTLLLLCFISLNPDSKGILSVTVFLTQVAATCVALPVGGLMAQTVSNEYKGRAGGWNQAGNLGGCALGGGAGVWLTTHASFQLAVVILSLVMIGCCLALIFVPPVYAEQGKSLPEGFKAIYSDLISLIHSPIAIYSIAVIITPIGIGACSHIWSSIAGDWQVNADGIALFTGTLNGIILAFGCMAGGWMADRFGRWNTFFGAGIAMAMITFTMSFLPQLPSTYKAGIMMYALVMGLNYASYSAIVLHAIGRGLASTKYALLSSVGNIPVVGMTAFVGWLHDARGVKDMLLGETFIGIGFVIISVLALYVLRIKKIIGTGTNVSIDPVVKRHAD